MKKYNRIFKGLKISFIFSVIMLIFLFVLILIKAFLTGEPFSFNSLVDLYVGILGYGSLESVPIVSQLLLSIVGIIFVTFFTSYLTMNLLSRNKLEVYENIVFWQIGDKIRASFLIMNSGADVSNVLFQLISYYNNERLEKSEDMMNPFIPNGSYWQIDFDLSYNSFMFDTIKNIHEKENCKLYAVVSYTDNQLGQQLTNTYLFEGKNIKGSSSKFGFNSVKKYKKNKIKNLVMFNEAEEVKTNVLSILMDTTVKFDLYKARPITNAIKITHDHLKWTNRQTIRNSIKSDINFENDDNADFAMAVIQYDPPQDWTKYYNNNGKLEFEIDGDDNIKAVQLEIKHGDMLNKVIDKKIPIEAYKMKFISIKLNDFGCEKEYQVIREICFTVFKNQVIKPISEFSITDLCIKHD